MLVVTAGLAHFDIILTAKALGGMPVAEIAVLFAVAPAVLVVTGGPDGIPVEPVAPRNAITGISAGLGLSFAPTRHFIGARAVDAFRWLLLTHCSSPAVRGAAPARVPGCRRATASPTPRSSRPGTPPRSGPAPAASRSSTAAGPWRVLPLATPFAAASDRTCGGSPIACSPGSTRFFPGTKASWTGRAQLSAWHRNPRALGAYSYGPTGCLHRYARYEGTAQGDVHLSGEHCGYDFQGFMEGGATEGERAAWQVIAASPEPAEDGTGDKRGSGMTEVFTAGRARQATAGAIGGD
ncbi:FAD-dependent oxidoreductase [Streptomyces sp. NPDC004050]